VKVLGVAKAPLLALGVIVRGRVRDVVAYDVVTRSAADQRRADQEARIK